MAVDPFDLTPEQLELQAWAAELLEDLQLDDHGWESEGRFPWEALGQLGEAGLTALTHPEGLGGRGASRLDAVLVLEQVAQASFTLAEAVQIATNGPAYVLSVLASPAVRDHYVPDVVAGRALISIAITEEDAGSSLGDIATTVTPTGDGHLLVDGVKCFVTGGGLASAHLVMARSAEGDGVRGLGYVLVPADAEGCEVVQEHEKIGGNAIPEAVVAFRGVRVPEDHLVVPGVAGSSAGFRQAMASYNAMRIGIAAMCCGVAQRAIDDVVAHLSSRRQFDRPLADFQGLRWRVARNVADLEAARLLTYRAARMADEHGFPPARETALAKLAASEVAVRAADEALQMFGWRGIVRAAAHPVERRYREVRGWTIAGGTTEALLNLIADGVFAEAGR